MTSRQQAEIIINGLREFQEANRNIIKSLRPGGDLGKAVKDITLEAQVYARSVTHIKTGALRVSHLASIRNGGEEGVIYINPQAVNPLGEEPAVYGPYEHQKGGDHAFYERTMEDIGPEAALRGLDLIVGSIRNA